MQLLGESLAASVKRELGELGDAGIGSLEWLSSWHALHAAIEATLQAADVDSAPTSWPTLRAASMRAGSRTPAAESGYCPPATAEPAAPDAMQTAFEKLNQQDSNPAAQADGDSGDCWPAGPTAQA
jgi:hypothetical protein